MTRHLNLLIAELVETYRFRHPFIPERRRVNATLGTNAIVSSTSAGSEIQFAVDLSVSTGLVVMPELVGEGFPPSGNILPLHFRLFNPQKAHKFKCTGIIKHLFS